MSSEQDTLIGTIYAKQTDDDHLEFLVVLDDHVIPTLSVDEFKERFGVDLTGQSVQGFEPVAILINPERLV